MGRRDGGYYDMQTELRLQRRLVRASLRNVYGPIILCERLIGRSFAWRCYVFSPTMQCHSLFHQRHCCPGCLKPGSLLWLMENIFMYVRKIVVPLEADVLTAKSTRFQRPQMTFPRYWSAKNIYASWLWKCANN